MFYLLFLKVVKGRIWPPQCLSKKAHQNVLLLSRGLNSGLAPYPPEVHLLCSIPGIGRRTVAYLLLFASGFISFQNYRQLIAKADLCPRKFSSGTSVQAPFTVWLNAINSLLTRSGRLWSRCYPPSENVATV
ncbi:MAG: hypothetical protein EOO56_00030 [Hymenobacter sp.]|nr:MAG: hypothetical protein EOO56_00030 [Hymenobacter sp.]